MKQVGYGDSQPPRQTIDPALLIDEKSQTVLNEYEQKGWVTSRRLDCVSPKGLRRTLYAGYRTEDKDKSYFEGFLNQLDKFSKKRNHYYD